jgi:nitroreductase
MNFRTEENTDAFTGAAKQESGAVLNYPERAAPVQYPISHLIARRWSPRAFDLDRPVEPHKILALLEAARWAPSSFNEQPWRYLLFDGSDRERLERARSCLMDFNRWARAAPLLMLSVTSEKFTANGSRNRHAEHDLGLSTENLVLEAVNQGLVLHQMAGFDQVRVRREFSIPAGFAPMTMIAVGYPKPDSLNGTPKSLRFTEEQPRSRKPISEIAFNGGWGLPYSPPQDGPGV